MALTKASLVDLNSAELILDLDADTSIRANTDDTVDIKIAGNVEVKMTATALAPGASDGNALGTAALEWSDLFLADGAVINFGDDQDVSLTHVADTGILLSSTDKLMFNDASQFIQGASATVLDIAATDEIELTATLIDVVGNLAVSGTIVGAGALTAATSITVGSAVLTEAELETLDGITVGTAIASKVVTTDANIDTSGQRNLTISGELDAATGDFSGDVDIDGTANLDVVDIDGATQIDAIVTVGVNDTGYDVKFFGDTSGAHLLWDASADDLKLVGAAGLTVAGATDLASLTVDNFTLDGNTLALSSGEMLLDAAADMVLDSGGATIELKDDGTHIGRFSLVNSNFTLKSIVSDKDIIFLGDDGGVEITALTLDMSAAGAATFNSTVTGTTFVGALTGNVTGNTSGTALTVTQAAQSAITSVGTLTALTVDDVAIDGKVMTMTGSSGDTFVTTVAANGATSLVTTDASAAAAHLTITADGTVDINSAGVLTLDSGAAINIEPASGSAILLDGTISVDAGVVTGATSITSTAFVGNLTGTVATATQNSITTATGLVSVGALDSGSITSGFTSIDVGAGAITTTGALSSGALTATGAVNLNGGAFTFNEAGADLDFRVESDGNANMLVVDGGNNRVGIGTGSALGTLHVASTADTNATTSYIIRGDATNDLPSSIDTQTSLLLMNTSDTYSNNLSIISSPVGTSTINFGDSADENIGRIGYAHNGNTMRFHVNTAEALRIETAGDVNVKAGDLIFGTAGKGIVLGATSNTAANTLDDYEEGDWSPTMTGSTTTGSYSYDTGRTYGRYTKIGNQVIVRFSVRVSGTTTAGQGSARVAGLPFTPTATSNYPRYPGSLLGQSTSTNAAYIFCCIEGTGTYIALFDQSTTTCDPIDVTDADHHDSIYAGQITYETNS